MRARGRMHRRFGCLLLVFALVIVSIGVLLLWGIAAVFGIAAANGDLLHLGRAAALVVLVALGLSLVVGVPMGRGIVRPLGDLIDGARRIENGDLGARVPMPNGPRDLRALAGAFNTMAARLQAEEETRRRLLADLGHELRTPIAVIEGHLEAVVDGVYPADAEHLDPILEETKVLARLVEDLRTVSLAEAGSLPLHREAVDLGHLVADVASALRPRAEARGATIRTDVAPGLPELDLDPVRIHQVLSNLVDNAIRYTPSGGSVIIAVAQGPHEPAPAVMLTVTDEGPGLAPDVRETLFDRFVKSTDSPGSGLGLAIARAIVEAHRGTIRAEAGPGGRGTSIVVQLPIEAPAS
jgi:signal transduction histidine kinase